jgi:hypothetical protein
MPSHALSQRRTTPAATFEEVPTQAGNESRAVQPEQPGFLLAQGRGRTPRQLADLILGILQNIEGFPKSGASITVYGYRHWNAMITFKPGCVSMKDGIEYRAMLGELVQNLRGRFDVEIPAT